LERERGGRLPVKWRGARGAREMGGPESGRQRRGS
jgi:hypothetical protein